MNLKSLRESYNKLLDSFKEMGVTLNESQQENVDNFMLQLESKLKDVRDVAIKTTKKMVTEKLDAEYKELFESILKHMNENAEVSSKIQNKINEMKVVEELSESVNGFLDEHVEEILPKKDIVDYERMQKLEQIHESLKNMLGVEIMNVEGGNKELVENLEKEKTEYSKKIEDLQKKLDESVKENKKVSKNLDSLKAQVLLESKIKNLPEREAKLIKESFKGASSSEINMKFKTVLESVRESVEDQAQIPSKEDEQKNLEDAILEVLNKDQSSDVNTNNDDTEDADVVNTMSETKDRQDILDESWNDVDAISEDDMKYWISKC